MFTGAKAPMVGLPLSRGSKILVSSIRFSGMYVFQATLVSQNVLSQRFGVPSIRAGDGVEFLENALR